MAKQRKKRTKKYSGIDAKVSAPTVVHVSAEERSRFKEWWLVYGRLAKLVGVVAGVALLLALCVIGIIGLAGG